MTFRAQYTTRSAWRPVFDRRRAARIMRQDFTAEDIVELFIVVFHFGWGGCCLFYHFLPEFDTPVVFNYLERLRPPLWMWGVPPLVLGSSLLFSLFTRNLAQRILTVGFSAGWVAWLALVIYRSSGFLPAIVHYLFVIYLAFWVAGRAASDE